MNPVSPSSPVEASPESEDRHPTHSRAESLPTRPRANSDPTMPEIPSTRLKEASSPSTPQTLEHGARPRKRVDWNLAGSTVAESTKFEDTIQSASKPRPVNLNITAANASSPTTPEQEEELRRDIHRMFSNQPVDQHDNQGQPQDPQPQTPSVPRIHVPGDKTAHPRPKKPVLRSGTATPQLNPTPPVELESGIENLAGKARSANVARAKADRLSKTLDHDEPPSSRHFLSRWMHPGRHKRDQSLSKTPLPLYHDGGEALASGQSTPEQADDLDYVPRPNKYRAAGLAAQMLLTGISPGGSRRSSFDESGSPTPVTPGSASPPLTLGGNSQRSSPRQSISNMSKFLHIPGGHSRPSSSDGSGTKGKAAYKRPTFGRFNSADHIDTGEGSSRGHSRHDSSASLFDNVSKYANIKSVQKTPSQRQRMKKQVDISIKKHVEETRMRQLYLLKLCKALMEYGAPSHRLEDYMKMSSRVLETEAQFLYMPGCMIVSFDDSTTHTTEVKLIRSPQGVDLGKLKDVHNVYKDVVHDNIGVREATEALTEILGRQKKFRVWFIILMHGFASATVGPFAFQARWIDLPVAFGLGLGVGFLRYVWAAKSDLYAAIFEVTSVILTSFAARGFGSITDTEGNYIFCFSALAQSAIALILPGYIILCGALELQSHNILAGSVRVFYAIIYALFIGFGLTIGSVIYGAIDKHAVSSSQCANPLRYEWNFMFVLFYTITLMVINQAKLQQMPMMLLISIVGYTVSYFSGTFFKGQSSVSSGLAALAVSLCANGYSRLGGWLHPRLEELYKTHGPWLREHGLVFRIHVERPDGDDEEALKMSKRPWWHSKVRVERVREKHADNNGKPEPMDESPPEHQSRHGSVASTITLGSMSEDPDSAIGPKDDASGHRQKTQKKVNYALAAAAMLPAIFVLVPSGLSVSGSLLQGIQAANEINSAAATATASGVPTATAGGSMATTSSPGSLANSNAFAVSFSVIEIAIGLTVGLFLGALIIYPYGKGGRGSKTRSGLFTF